MQTPAPAKHRSKWTDALCRAESFENFNTSRPNSHGKYLNEARFLISLFLVSEKLINDIYADTITTIHTQRASSKRGLRLIARKTRFKY